RPSGIIDENVDGSEQSLDLLNPGVDRRQIGKIPADRTGDTLVIDDIGHRCGRRIGVEISRGDLRAFGCQRSRDCTPQSAARPHYQRALASNSEIHSTPAHDCRFRQRVYALKRGFEPWSCYLLKLKFLLPSAVNLGVPLAL